MTTLQIFPQLLTQPQNMGAANPRLQTEFGLKLLTVLAATLCLVLALLGSGCGQADDATGSSRVATTLDINYYWQPFTQTSVWNLALPTSGRSETAIPSSALNAGDGLFDPNDGPYGLYVYFAKSTDPLWSVQYGNYVSAAGGSGGNPTSIRAPLGMIPPTGSDGSIIIVDDQLRYAYEIWQFSPRGGTSAYASSINVVDLQSSGIDGSNGLSGSGLPGIGGLLKDYEAKNDVAIRHKLWLAVSPAVLYSGFLAPATATDIRGTGADAFLHYGDVVALSQSWNVASNECNLSPFMQRIATALQNYGGIIQDQGGDFMSISAEVNAVKNYIDVDYNSTMWTMFACMKNHLVKVNNPWTNAKAGGLGFNSGMGSSPPTVPQKVAATALTDSQVGVSWAASTDTNGVAGYHVMRNGSVVASTTSVAYTDGSLVPSTKYSYTVSAYDAAGNDSAASSVASVTTPSAPAPPPQTQLLSNGGFESGLSPWFTQVWGGSPKIALVSSGAHSGKDALSITNASSTSQGIGGQNFTVGGNVALTAQAYLRLSGVTSGVAMLVMDFFGSSGNLLGEVVSAGQSQNSSGYNLEKLTATTPANTVSAGIYLYSYVQGTVLFDDVSVTK